jgi:diadenosine tetraphosphatase ApaH/serine/threonine PP2A family protein phosphatase
MLAIAWTRQQLDESQRAFLRALPLTAEERDHFYVHSSAAAPARWEYVLDERAAARSLHATKADRTFCGHTHVPALFHLTATGHVAAFEPLDGVAMPLTWHRRWVAVIGAVGQPRDGNPAACYAVFDDVARELTYVRVPYDIASAQRKIRDAGLPPFLSARLARGM